MLFTIDPQYAQDETTAGSLGKDAEDYGAEVAQRLLESVVGHWKSKSADAVLADAQQNDFELRLKAFKTLGTSAASACTYILYTVVMAMLFNLGWFLIVRLSSSPRKAPLWKATSGKCCWPVPTAAPSS